VREECRQFSENDIPGGRKPDADPPAEIAGDETRRSAISVGLNVRVPDYLAPARQFAPDVRGEFLG